MVIPTFHGDVTDDGRLVLDAGEKFARSNYLRSLAGRRVSVTVKVDRNKRSAEQNAWLWGVALPTLAKSFGYDKHEHEQLHYQLLAECFGTKYDQRFGRDVPNITSSQLNTAEFSDYMEWLVRWAAMEHGCIVPLPNESEAA